MYASMGICISCKPPCLECSSTYQICISCQMGYSLYDDNCVLGCPDGYYDEYSVCIAC